MSSHPEVNRSKSTDPLQIESINEVMDFLTHGGLEYTDEFNNQSNGFDCTIYIARKK